MRYHLQRKVTRGFCEVAEILILKQLFATYNFCKEKYKCNKLKKAINFMLNFLKDEIFLILVKILSVGVEPFT